MICIFFILKLLCIKQKNNYIEIWNKGLFYFLQLKGIEQDIRLDVVLGQILDLINGEVFFVKGFYVLLLLWFFRRILSGM